MTDALRIISVLPDLLGTYGDGGNVVVLERRLAWRGIAAEVVRTTPADPCPAGGDLYVLGGGEDLPQLAALRLLLAAGAVATFSGGVPVLAVCAGIQLLGTSLLGAESERIDGLGVLDLTTARLTVRAVGEVVADVDPGLGVAPLTGFVNHGGATTLGDGLRALGRVTVGPGNAGAGDTAEGVLAGAVIGTYLHGPVLARNPQFADLILERALGASLPSLADGPEQSLYAERIAASRRQS